MNPSTNPLPPMLSLLLPSSASETKALSTPPPRARRPKTHQPPSLQMKVTKRHDAYAMKYFQILTLTVADERHTPMARRLAEQFRRDLQDLLTPLLNSSDLQTKAHRLVEAGHPLVMPAPALAVAIAAESASAFQSSPRTTLTSSSPTPDRSSEHAPSVQLLSARREINLRQEVEKMLGADGLITLHFGRQHHPNRPRVNRVLFPPSPTRGPGSQMLE